MRQRRSVDVSPDGYFFLVGGAHHVAKLFTGENVPTQQSIDTFWENHASRKAYCQQAGIVFQYTVFPEKIVTIRESAEAMLGKSVRSVYLEHYGQSDDVLYPLDRLHPKDSYPRTESHFSHSGYVEILTQILKRIGCAYPDSLDAQMNADLHIVEEHSGDLTQMFDPKPTESIHRLCLPKPARIRTNGLVRGNQGIIAIARNEKAFNQRKLLIMGDSFLYQMTHYLTRIFSTIAFIRTPFFHREAVESFQPDIILQGCAERYLSHCRSDEERPHFLAYPLLSGTPTNPKKGFAEAFEATFNQTKLRSP